jgi:hypothetical protein
MRTVEEVLAELVPMTSSQIARKLQDEGITGRRKRECDCPIAKYIVRETAHDRVSVSPTAVQVPCPASYWPRTLMLPVNVATFVLLFDRGLYPKLEARSV